MTQQREVDLSNVRRQAIGAAGNVDVNATIIGITSTGAAYTITLQTEALLKGKMYIIRDEGGASNTDNITVATEGSETIDGGATAVLDVNDQTLWIYSDGANWHTLTPTDPAL